MRKLNAAHEVASNKHIHNIVTLAKAEWVLISSRKKVDFFISGGDSDVYIYTYYSTPSVLCQSIVHKETTNPSGLASARKLPSAIRRRLPLSADFPPESSFE